MTPGPTVNLSSRRTSVRCALTLALLWLALPAQAVPAPGNGLTLPSLAFQQPDLTDHSAIPSVTFAKKDDKGGGGGAGNSGQGNDKDKNKGEDKKEDKKDKKDKKDNKDNEDQQRDDGHDHENEEGRHEHDNGNGEDRHDHDNNGDRHDRGDDEGHADAGDDGSHSGDADEAVQDEQQEQHAGEEQDQSESQHDGDSGADANSDHGAGQGGSDTIGDDSASIDGSSEPSGGGDEVLATDTSPDEDPVAEASTNDAEPHLMLSGTPPEAVTAGDLYLFTPGIEASSETPPVFMIDGLPHWAGFNEINGELYGAPAEEDIGFYGAITISATDGVVETSLPTFSIEVVAAGAAQGAVTLSWMPPTENEDGSYLTDLAGYWVYWGNNPGTYTEWMRIDNPGLTAIVIEGLVPGSWEFAMTSFNADGVESSLSNAVTRVVE